MSVGRAPNGRKIAADQAGVAVTDRGFIPVDSQMRTNVPHIFAIGDVVGQPMLAHKAVHEGHVAAEAAAGHKRHFDARVVPSVAYTDPEIAWVGLTEDEAKAKGIKVEKGLFPWAASGRAIANGRDEGHTKLLFDAATHRIVGGGIVGTHAGDLIGEIALAIEMGADMVDIAHTIHPHPDAGRIDRARRRSGRGHLHRPAAGAQALTGVACDRLRGDAGRRPQRQSGNRAAARRFARWGACGVGVAPAKTATTTGRCATRRRPSLSARRGRTGAAACR